VGRSASAVAQTWREVREHASPAERDTMVLLATAALVTPIMGTLNLSPVLGFLFAGILLGRYRPARHFSSCRPNAFLA